MKRIYYRPLHSRKLTERESERYKRRLGALDLTQRYVAEQMGCPAGSLSAWLNGNYPSKKMRTQFESFLTREEVARRESRRRDRQSETNLEQVEAPDDAEALDRGGGRLATPAPLLRGDERTREPERAA